LAGKPPARQYGQPEILNRKSKDEESQSQRRCILRETNTGSGNGLWILPVSYWPFHC